MKRHRFSQEIKLLHELANKNLSKKMYALVKMLGQHIYIRYYSIILLRKINRQPSSPASHPHRRSVTEVG